MLLTQVFPVRLVLGENASVRNEVAQLSLDSDFDVVPDDSPRPRSSSIKTPLTIAYEDFDLTPSPPNVPHETRNTLTTSTVKDRTATVTTATASRVTPSPAQPIFPEEEDLENSVFEDKDEQSAAEAAAAVRKAAAAAAAEKAALVEAEIQKQEKQRIEAEA